jgi:hypothetical protein
MTGAPAHFTLQRTCTLIKLSNAAMTEFAVEDERSSTLSEGRAPGGWTYPNERLRGRPRGKGKGGNG